MKFSREEKAMWLEDWRRSGKSAWAYGKANGFVPQTFTRWVQLEREEKQSFVEVPKQAIACFEKAPEILIEKGDIKIHIPLSIWVEDSRAVMEGLKGAI